jgi:hypothetical protein
MRSHGPGRGTRRYKGVQSGTTFASIPSGTTMDCHGVNFGGGTQLKMNSGSAAWAGATLNITHGFTTLTGFSSSVVQDSGSGVTAPAVPWVQDTGVSGGVSLAFRSIQSSNAILGTGGNVKWVAFGTD